MKSCSRCGCDGQSQKYLEYCECCGAPAVAHEYNAYDPFRASRHWQVGRVDRRAKTVVRAGCFVVGLVVAFSGGVLFHGAWLSMTSTDPLCIWVSRALGPMLLLMGTLFIFSAFRAPPLAPVIALNKTNQRSSR